MLILTSVQHKKSSDFKFVESARYHKIYSFIAKAMEKTAVERSVKYYLRLQN